MTPGRYEETRTVKLQRHLWRKFFLRSALVQHTLAIEHRLLSTFTKSRSGVESGLGRLELAAKVRRPICPAIDKAKSRSNVEEPLIVPKFFVFRWEDVAHAVPSHGATFGMFFRFVFRGMFARDARRSW